MEALTVEDARAYYGAAAGPATTAFIATGDIDLETAVALASAHFGDWSAEETQKPAVPPSPEVREREQVVLIERPGLEQTVVLLGRPGLAVDDEDELALLLAGQVFGGMFGSRLNLNLREDKGYTYGAFSRTQSRRGIGPITAGSSVHAEATGAALEQIFLELHGLSERPITEDEFQAAREGFISSIPGRFETIQALASTGAGIFWRDLSLDRYDRIVAGLREITLEDVQAAAERYFDPGSMQLVLVGDPDLVNEQVGALELGEVVTHSAASSL